jgi:hypothetical protein
VAQDSLHLDVIALDERDVADVAASVVWAVERIISRTSGTSDSPGE